MPPTVPPAIPRYRSADPTRTYYVYNAAWSFLATLSFTLNLVYYVRDVGLDPLQMVLVGTTLEVACFLFEIPTPASSPICTAAGSRS
jgi:DHA3 family tetracycline resistance protein-like MFS transporter